MFGLLFLHPACIQYSNIPDKKSKSSRFTSITACMHAPNGRHFYGLCAFHVIGWFQKGSFFFFLATFFCRGQFSLPSCLLFCTCLKLSMWRHNTWIPSTLRTNRTSLGRRNYFRKKWRVSELQTVCHEQEQQWPCNGGKKVGKKCVSPFPAPEKLGARKKMKTTSKKEPETRNVFLWISRGIDLRNY